MVRVFTLLLWLIAVPFAAPLSAQEREIEGVIADQLRAFNERDVAEAWQYAAPNIQSIFRDAQTFGGMVQRGYPMVWTNSDVQFLDQQDFGAATRQVIRLTDEQGGFHFLEYRMIETPDGWRIAGVQILPQPDVGA